MDATAWVEICSGYEAPHQASFGACESQGGLWQYKECVKERIKQTIGNVINTSFVERMNLTLRHHVPALARRTIQIAKTALGLEQQLSVKLPALWAGSFTYPLAF